MAMTVKGLRDALAPLPDAANVRSALAEDGKNYEGIVERVVANEDPPGHPAHVVFLMCSDTNPNSSAESKARRLAQAAMVRMALASRPAFPAEPDEESEPEAHAAWKLAEAEEVGIRTALGAAADALEGK